MRLLTHYFALTLPILVVSGVNAQVSFEGYYRIDEGGKHIGYGLQRTKFDPKTRQRSVTYYVSRDKAHEKYRYQMKSVSTEDFSPVEFEVSVSVNDIDMQKRGKFAKGTAIITELNPKTHKAAAPAETFKLDSESVFSSFFFSLLDLTKLVANQPVAYVNFSEENSHNADGELKLVASRDVSGQKIYHLQDDFEGEALAYFLFADGEALGSRDDSVSRITYLVAGRDEAVGEFEFSQKKITEIFGDLPAGDKNPVTTARGAMDAYRIVKSFEVPKAVEPRKAKSEGPRPVVIPAPLKARR